MVTNMKKSTEEVQHYEYEQPPQSGIYNTNVLETVQSATIGSAAVRYNTQPGPSAVPVTHVLKTVKSATFGSAAVKYNTEPTPPPAPATNVLETVQGATFGYAAVQYNTEPTSPPVPTPAPAPPAVMPKEEEEGTATKSEELCRDFIQGRCAREDCKFKHDSAARESDSIKPSTICKDYQNSVCRRNHCKFLHITKADTEEYEKSGVMPAKKSEVKVDGPEQCRDFLKGQCMRGNMCRYAHNAATDFGNGSLLGLQGKRPYSALPANITISGGTSQQVNEELKQKLLELRKQVLELSELNDALYSENQKFRKQLTGEKSLLGGKMSLLPSPYSAKNGYGY